MPVVDRGVDNVAEPLSVSDSDLDNDTSWVVESAIEGVAVGIDVSDGVMEDVTVARVADRTIELVRVGTGVAVGDPEADMVTGMELVDVKAETVGVIENVEVQSNRVALVGGANVAVEKGRKRLLHTRTVIAAPVGLPPNRLEGGSSERSLLDICSPLPTKGVVIVVLAPRTVL